MNSLAVIFLRPFVVLLINGSHGMAHGLRTATDQLLGTIARVLCVLKATSSAVSMNSGERAQEICYVVTVIRSSLYLKIG